MGKRKYTKEFKQEAVKLTESNSIAQVSRDLGIHENQLGKWKREQKVNPVNAFTGKKTPEQEEIKELRKQLADITQQRDILKKAVAIFSK